MTHRASRWSVTITAVIGLIAALIVAVSSNSSRASVPVTQPAVAPEAQAAFSGLKTGAAPSVSADVVRVGNSKLDDGSLRRTDQADGHETYVMAGPTDVCVFVRIPGKADGGSCRPAAGAADGTGAPMFALPIHATGPTQWIVSALVPDGVQSVRFGGGATASVVNNTATVVTDSLPHGMTFAMPGGTVRTIGRLDAG